MSSLDINDSVFCVVDVETNGSKADLHQIIEIGAVKVQNGEIIDRFESLVRCVEIPEIVEKITGINVDDTYYAPYMDSVMGEFMSFLGDSIFVGHDAKFDYKFVSAMLERCHRKPLNNPMLCTIELAERTIPAERYGLAYLNELLELNADANHHRALDDALTTAYLLIETLKSLPINIKNIDDLIKFSKNAKRVKKPKPVETDN